MNNLFLMQRFYLVFIVIGLFFSCKQPKSNYPEYYRQYNKVLRLEDAGNTELAFEKFREAEKLVEFVPVQHLLTARSLALSLDNCELVLEYFQKAVNNGYEYDFSDFSPLSCPEINNQSVKFIRFDYDYQRQVDSLHAIDQGSRSSNNDIQSKDKSNIEKLLSLIEQRGYPSSKLVGDQTSGKAFIILLHFDSDLGNKRLKPILEDAYHQGYLNPGQYAWIIDRRKNWGPEKLDPYFYQLPTEKYFELSEYEISIIDKRRDSIGLKPLSEMNIHKNENGRISIQF